MNKNQIQQCMFCEGKDLSLVHTYTERPQGEIPYVLSPEEASYKRELYRCNSCQHIYSCHDFDLRSLYEQDYVNTTYGAGGIEAAFQKIISLAPEKSDNVARVARVEEFRAKHFPKIVRPHCLDIGSGLCVFLHRLKSFGWDCTALDPDERATRHARETVGIPAVQGDFFDYAEKSRFDLLSFNKVLEHVENPQAMLAHASRYVSPKGYLYIEVPDAEAAAQDGFHREEFFIEHHHVFSASSLALLVQKSGFRVIELERLQEPSSKYTLRVFGSAHSPCGLV